MKKKVFLYAQVEFSLFIRGVILGLAVHFYDNIKGVFPSENTKNLPKPVELLSGNWTCPVNLLREALLFRSTWTVINANDHNIFPIYEILPLVNMTQLLLHIIVQNSLILCTDDCDLKCTENSRKKYPVLKTLFYLSIS